MRFAVLSDTVHPTSAKFAGHGLGKLALSIANGLLRTGHDVVLFAGKGSEFDSELIIEDDERRFNAAFPTAKPFDAILDITHFHTLQELMQKAAIVNVSVDREASPGRCAVFPSEHHREWHGYRKENARIIPHGVNIPDLGTVEKEDYFAYLSMMYPQKGPLMAAEAARLAGVPLIMAGPTPPQPPAGVKYIGPLDDEDKFRFLAKAKALLYPASTESGGLVPLEAQAVGTPAIVSAHGAAREQILEGKTGFAVEDTLGIVEAIAKIDAIKGDDCRDYIKNERNLKKMIDAYEQALIDVSKGEVW